MIREADEDGVTETIGFIFIFGIVILSMSLIYAMGYPQLQSNMAANVFESTEQSFIVLQSNMKRVALDQVPLKNLKIKLHDTTISATNDSNITVYYNGTLQPSLSCQTGEIKYLKDERVLTYENGGVWKTYPGGKVMVSHPHIYSTTTKDTNFTTISVISINGRGSVGGKGVATTLGAYIALAVKPLLCVIVVFLIIVAITRYISLGSLTAALSFPIFSLLFNKNINIILFGFFVFLIIAIKHKKNIKQLISGTENKLGAKKI